MADRLDEIRERWLTLCGQGDVLGDQCPECGGWLHAVVPGGYQAGGLSYCSEDCIADHQQRVQLVDATYHLRVRDVLCDCAAVCAPRGLPSAADLAEYAAWRAEAVTP